MPPIVSTKGAHMSKKDPKKGKPKSKSPAKPGDAELTDEQLERVAGGASDIFAKLGDIKGESIDDKHKDEIEVLATNPFKVQLKPW